MINLTLSVIVLALLSTGALAGDDPYGRLFTTPDQRARLDSRFSGHSAGNEAISDTGGNELQNPRPLKLNGTLTSSIGKKEVWINGESQLAPGEGQSSRIQLLKAGNVRVKPSESSQEHDMKPGQILDPNTGTVIEAYEQASVPYNHPQDTDGASTSNTIQ